jgi:ADP-ribose pyrophosphatase YjhB (NUDIX family)
MSDDFRADFLGAFAVATRGDRTLMVANERRIGGQLVTTWDLPGGRVEAGELLGEALDRELREEIGLGLVGAPRFLFVREGERVAGGRRVHAWRSVFFAVELAPGEPVAGHEVQAVRWCDRRELAAALTAPYHDSFCRWLRDGGSYFTSAWCD